MVEEAGFRRWEVRDPEAILLLVHGLGATAQRWQAMAEYFAGHGISSFALELPDFKGYVHHILRSRQTVSRSNPSKKIFLLGESLGGIASLIAVSGRPGLFDGLVCLSPAFKSVVKLSAFEYIKIFTSIFYDPNKEIRLPFDISMCTRDVNYHKDSEAETGQTRKAGAGSLVETLITQVRAGISASGVETPVIFMLAGDDKIVDTDASVKIFERMRTMDKTIKIYPDMYHSLSIDIGKEKVFADLLEWINARTKG